MATASVGYLLTVNGFILSECFFNQRLMLHNNVARYCESILSGQSDSALIEFIMPNGRVRSAFLFGMQKTVVVRLLCQTGTELEYLSNKD